VLHICCIKQSLHIGSLAAAMDGANMYKHPMFSGDADFIPATLQMVLRKLHRLRCPKELWLIK
jgi:hypothetical protein